MNEEISIAVYRDGVTGRFRVALETNTGGRRLAGPKFSGSSTLITRRTLDQHDKNEILRLLGAPKPAPTPLSARYYRDEDCPACGAGETYTEITTPTADTPGATTVGCRCGWQLNPATGDESVPADAPLPEGWEEWSEESEYTGMTAAERAADPVRAMLAKHAYFRTADVTDETLATYDALPDRAAKDTYVDELWG